ncbi:MAG TPA: hypothetical protein VLG39_06160 [Nitrospirota bacterium]|nr:hypothetical protein [Nitrospirota bacterium]
MISGDLDQRHKEEPVFVIGPGKEGGLLKGFAGSYRSRDGLELAEERLKGVGFTKCEDGNRVSYRRELVGYHLYADPRPDSRIHIYVYPREKEGMRRKRRAGSPFPVLLDFPNTWKHDLEEKLASKIRKYCHE